MIIGSRLPEIAREVQNSADASVAEKRQRSVTSGRSGDSTRQLTNEQRILLNNNGADSVSESKMKPIDIHKAVEKLNKLIHAQQSYISFSVNKEAHVTVIRIFKTETGELIKQFPPDEILAMIIRIRKNIGLLVDSKA